MLTTPGGQAGLFADLGKQDAPSSEREFAAGFITTVLPAASAGAIFQASMSVGKFHGMICPHTP